MAKQPTANKYHGMAAWVGILGDEENVVLNLTTLDGTDHEFALPPNQAKFLYDLLSGFCG